MFRHRALLYLRRLLHHLYPIQTALTGTRLHTCEKKPSLCTAMPLSDRYCVSVCCCICRCRHDSTGNTCVDGRCGECKICQPDFDPTATTAAAKTTADKHNCAEWCDNRAHTHCNASLTASVRSLCVCVPAAGVTRIRVERRSCAAAVRFARLNRS